MSRENAQGARTLLESNRIAHFTLAHFDLVSGFSKCDAVNIICIYTRFQVARRACEGVFGRTACTHNTSKKTQIVPKYYSPHSLHQKKKKVGTQPETFK